MPIFKRIKNILKPSLGFHSVTEALKRLNGNNFPLNEVTSSSFEHIFSKHLCGASASYLTAEVAKT